MGLKTWSIGSKSLNCLTSTKVWGRNKRISRRKGALITFGWTRSTSSWRTSTRSCWLWLVTHASPRRTSRALNSPPSPSSFGWSTWPRSCSFWTLYSTSCGSTETSTGHLWLNTGESLASTPSRDGSSLTLWPLSLSTCWTKATFYGSSLSDWSVCQESWRSSTSSPSRKTCNFLWLATVAARRSSARSQCARSTQSSDSYCWLLWSHTSSQCYSIFFRMISTFKKISTTIARSLLTTTSIQTAWATTTDYLR